MHISLERSFDIDHFEVKYPELFILCDPPLKYSYENAKYAQVMTNIFDRFDTLCRFHNVSLLDFIPLSNRNEYKNFVNSIHLARL